MGSIGKSIRLAGVFPNPDNVLRPGQYGRVRFVSYVRPGALLVPQKAVTVLQGLYQVAVVGSDNKVSLRTVQVGEQTGPMWIIEQGQARRASSGRRPPKSQRRHASEDRDCHRVESLVGVSRS